MKAFLSLLKNTQKLGASTVKKIAVITADTHSDDKATHAEVGVGIATNAGLFGICNTARQELIGTPIQYIDTEYYATAATLKGLAKEIFIGEGFGPLLFLAQSPHEHGQ